MAEDHDYNPGAWKGHDFNSARAHYDTHAGRSYTAAKAAGTTDADMVPAQVSTESTSPLVIMVDVTGSMGQWPATMFSKLPYLDLEGKEYMGADMEISWAAQGDANKGDRFPLQVMPFTSGTDLKTEMEKLVVVGGGGGGGDETYELGALYYAHNCNMPNAVKPIFIFVGDEMPYDRVSVASALSVCKVRLQKDLSTEEVFEQLKQKFAVYHIHKPYSDAGATRRRWVNLLGEDHIADLQDPNRVVDVIFGILARETGRVAYFKRELEGRQRPDQVQTVYKALNTIHRLPGPTEGGHSTLHRPTGGTKSKGLL